MVEQIVIKRSKLFSNWPPSENRMCVNEIFTFGQLLHFSFNSLSSYYVSNLCQVFKMVKLFTSNRPKIVFVLVFIFVPIYFHNCF